MVFFRWILLIAAALYGGLTAYAGFTNIKDKKTSLSANIFMIAGGTLMLISVIPETFDSFQIYLIILGLMAIYSGTMINTIRLYGKITFGNQIKWVFYSALIILLYFMKK